MALAGRFCARVERARRISVSSASGTFVSSQSERGDSRASGSARSSHTDELAVVQHRQMSDVVLAHHPMRLGHRRGARDRPRLLGHEV
jgi:hypothetical protein